MNFENINPNEENKLPDDLNEDYSSEDEILEKNEKRDREDKLEDDFEEEEEEEEKKDDDVDKLDIPWDEAEKE